MDVGLVGAPWLKDPMLYEMRMPDGGRVLQLHVGARVWDVEVGLGSRCDSIDLGRLEHGCILWDGHDGPHVSARMSVPLSFGVFWWPRHLAITSMRTSSGYPITVHRATDA